MTDNYSKMEKLEHTARVVLAARLQGLLAPLPAAEAKKLDRLGRGIRRADKVRQPGQL